MSLSRELIESTPASSSWRNRAQRAVAVDILNIDPVIAAAIILKGHRRKSGPHYARGQSRLVRRQRGHGELLAHHLARCVEPRRLDRGIPETSLIDPIGESAGTNLHVLHENLLIRSQRHNYQTGITPLARTFGVEFLPIKTV